MVQRFFVDTSVFGGVYEPEFRRESEMLFDMVKEGRIICLYSDFVEDELVKAPPRVRNFLNDLPNKHRKMVEVTSEVRELAQAYIDEKVIGKTSFVDCTHIAAATIYGADVLVSWNFRHIVGISRVRDYNLVNMKRGYRVLNIRSPREIVGSLWDQK
jgi:predicted nucleic acid-binding protein